MAEFLRIRCPICNSLPNLKQLENAETSDHEVRVWLVKMGGKVAVPKEEGVYIKKKQGGAAGVMEYIDVTDTHPEELAIYKKKFAEWCIQFAINAGYIKG